MGSVLLKKKNWDRNFREGAFGNEFVHSAREKVISEKKGGNNHEHKTLLRNGIWGWGKNLPKGSISKRESKPKKRDIQRSKQKGLSIPFMR